MTDGLAGLAGVLVVVIFAIVYVTLLTRFVLHLITFAYNIALLLMPIQRGEPFSVAGQAMSKRERAVGKKDKAEKAHCDYDFDAIVKNGGEALCEDMDKFIERIKAAGVDRETASLVRARVWLEHARATESAVKEYLSDAECCPRDGEFPIGELLETLARRTNGLYASVLGLGEEMGRGNFIYEGVAQAAFDLSMFAKRVSDGFGAARTVKWHKKKNLA